MEETNINIEEIITWTDEQCEEFDKNNRLQAKVVRDIVSKWNQLSKDYIQLYNNFNQLQGILSNGQMLGYQISCPNCKVSYRVKPDELNYNVEITCQDCGTKYIQNKNIFGIYIREDNKNAAQE